MQEYILEEPAVAQRAMFLALDQSQVAAERRHGLGDLGGEVDHFDRALAVDEVGEVLRGVVFAVEAGDRFRLCKCFFFLGSYFWEFPFTGGFPLPSLRA